MRLFYGKSPAIPGMPGNFRLDVAQPLTLLSNSGRTRCFAAELIPCAMEVETCTWRVLPEILHPKNERDLVAKITARLMPL